MATSRYGIRRSGENSRLSGLENYIMKKENPLENYLTPAGDGDSEEKNIFERSLATVGDLGANVVSGFSKGIEGIVDLGRGVFGAVAGIFDKEHQAAVKKAISYDWTGENITKHLQRATEGSYLKDGGIIEGIASGVGQMLPAVLISAATAGAGAPAAVSQALSLGTLGVSAAGSGTEEAFNEGAEYYQGLGYGAASGAVEAATEKLGGMVLGRTSALSDTFIGKQLIKTGADKFVRSGVGKVAYNFASEGLEEVISDVASGVNKGIFNTKNEDGNVLERIGNQDWRGIASSLPETFVVGGAVGTVMDGLRTGVSNIKNRSKGGSTYNKIIDELNTIEDTLKANEAVKQSRKYKQEDVDEFETAANKRLIKSVERLSEKVEKLTPEQRASLFSDAPVLSLYVNNDGSVNSDLITLANEQVKSGKATNTTSRIYDLSDYSDTMKAAVEEYNELHGLEDGTEIKIYEGELSAEARKTFTDMAKSVKSFGKKAGTNLDIAIIESNREDMNGFRAGNTVFITEKQLKNGSWAESYSHEIGHFAQGSSSFKAMADFLTEDKEAYSSAKDAVTNAWYGVSAEEIDSAMEKARAGEELSENEQRAYNELTAKMIGKIIGTEASIRRMARDNSTLARKLFNRISDMIESFKGTNADKATLRRLRKAEILFEETLETMSKDKAKAEKKYEDTLAEYKAAKKEYKKLPEEQREAWLEERGYSAEDFEAGVLEDEDLSLLSDEERKEYSKRFEREGKKIRTRDGSYDTENVENRDANDHKNENMVVRQGKREAVEFELGDRPKGYEDFDKPITLDDVKKIHDISRKKGNLSINSFTSEEIEATQKWAYKFYKELGVKSPFFRASFGEWRAHQVNDLIAIQNYKKSEGKNPRGQYRNNDTGWLINSSSVGYDETISHSGKDKKSIVAMQHIDDIIQNGILLDTEVSQPGRGKKSIYTAFMHKFYSIIKIDGIKYVAKMAVDESYAPGQESTNKKFYHVRAIKIEAIPSVGIGKNHTPIMESTASTYSISDLYEFVKTYDKDFTPAPEVSKYVLNDDGTPRVFYHGTNAKFYAFEKGHKRTRGRLNLGEGFYFAASKDYAKDYIDESGNVIEAYVVVRNPYIVVGNQFTEWEMDDIRSKLSAEDKVKLNYDNVNEFLAKLGYDGVVGMFYSGTTKSIFTVVAFEPTQIKSATDNIGTFDKEQKNINFDLSPSEGKIHKRIAEWEKMKVYEKADAEKIINNIITSVLPLDENDAAVLDGASKKQAETFLWGKLNSALTELEKKKAAEEVAEYIISRSVVKTWLNDYADLDAINRAGQTINYLKGFLHNLNISNIKEEIRHRYDTEAKGVMLMWGSKKSGFGVDEIVSEINSQVKGYGFPIDSTMSEADIFFAIHEGYAEARGELKSLYEKYRERALDNEERTRLKTEITEKILNAYEEMGEESELAHATRRFKTELWKAEKTVEYMKAYNKLIKTVDSFKDVQMGRFQNANTYKSDLFDGSVAQLKKIVRGGAISIKGTRDAIANLVQWYTKANPIIGDSFDQDVYDKLAMLAEKSAVNVKGEKVEIRELLEPYRHRLNISNIEALVKKGYGEEYLKVAASWKKKKGYEEATISEVVKVLEENGIEISTDEYDAFTQIVEMHRDAVGPFTVDDIKRLTDVVSYFAKFIKEYNKIYVKGKYVEALPKAKQFVELMKKNRQLRLGMFDKLFGGRYAKTFMRPITIAKYMDRYGDGFYTEAIKNFREGTVNANDYEYEMMKPVVEFAEKYKKYFEELSKRTVNYGERQIPADIALSLYLTSKREQAQAGLATSGFEYENGKETERFPGYMPQVIPGGIQLGAERMQKRLYDEFSKEDKEFLGIVEKIFNEECKRLKYDTDMNTKGYSNTVEGFYYPIRRAFVAKSIDSDFEDLMGRASNKSFNKDTVKGARGILCIMPLTEVFARHVRGVSQYAALATVVRNYDILYNLDTGGDANSPTSIASEGERTWKEGADYLKKLLSDVQGIGDKGSPLLSVIRGSYAKYQLGANPKTWVTQLSSFFASTSELDYDSIIKGFGVDSSDVDEYCTVAKLREANNEAILAQANANRPGILEKKSKIGKTLDKFGDILMAPIGKVDRFVIKKLFGACQVQIEKNGGAKVGTVENKTEAGKLLAEVIFNTQQNSFATERSAAMRSNNEIMKSVTMFSADGMNVIGQFIDAIGELAALKARARAGENLDSEIKAAGKRVRRSLGAIVASAVFMTAIAMLFNWLYHRYDEDDEAGDIAMDAVGNLGGNMIGGLVGLRDVYSYFVDGYEVNNYLYSALNDTLGAVQGITEMTGKIVTGAADKRIVAKNLRELLYAAGQLTGIPARNAYNLIYSMLGWDKNLRYNIDDLFYAQAYSTDLSRAVEREDEAAVANIAGLILGESVGGIKDKKVLEELNRLSLAGQKVLPRMVGDSFTYNDVEYEMTNKQQKRFKGICSQANDGVSALIALKQYSKADDEAKAKAIGYLYDTYYEFAKSDRTGETEKSKDELFLTAVDAQWLAIAVGVAGTLEADKDKNGKTVSGSRKKKVVDFVESLNISAAQKYMIMGYLGYSNTKGEAKVKAYINGLKLSKEEKAKLLKYSGYKK